MSLFSRSSYTPSQRQAAAQMHVLIMLGLAALLLIINIFFPHLVTTLRSAVTDLTAPALHAITEPGRGIGSGWQEWMNAREENKRLQEEVKNLKEWRLLAGQYGEENKSLKALLKYKDDTVQKSLTAKVIAQAGGNFAQSVVVTAGQRDGVKKDMIAMNEDGVVGRVIEAGEWTARVLLLNDINSRLPVMLKTGERAILAGMGDGNLKLLYLTQETTAKIGTVVETSGHGGIFPPHLPVGIISTVKGRDVLVTPYAHLDALTMLRLVIYELAGGTQNPMNNQGAQPVPQPSAQPVTAPSAVKNIP